MSGHAEWLLSEWFAAIEQSEMGSGELKTLRTGAGPTVCIEWLTCFVAFAQDGCVFFERPTEAGQAKRARTPAELRAILDDYAARIS